MRTLDEVTQIAFLPSHQTLFVHFTGDLTLAHAAGARNAVRAAWQANPTLAAILVDLQEVRHLDSSGVGALLELTSQAKRAGVPFRLCRLQDSPRRLLHRTGLASLFEIYADLEAGQPNPYLTNS